MAISNETIPLPPAPSKPCWDCPWRRNATPGWLGGHDAEHWIEVAHSEAGVNCHLTTRDPALGDPGARMAVPVPHRSVRPMTWRRFAARFMALLVFELVAGAYLPVVVR